MSTDLNEIKSAVSAEFASQQTALLQNVKTAIAEALKNDQKLIVVSEQQKEEQKEGKSHGWDIAQLIISAAIGLVVWLTQSTLSDRINATNQAISTKYVLTQEYYKERFKVYQLTYQRLAALQGALEAAKADGRSKRDAIDALTKLNDQIDQQELYFSPEVFKVLSDISFKAAQMPTVNPHGSAKLPDLEAQIIDLKKRMYAEVSGEIGNLSPPAIK